MGDRPKAEMTDDLIAAVVANLNAKADLAEAERRAKEAKRVVMNTRSEMYRLAPDGLDNVRSGWRWPDIIEWVREGCP